MIPIMDDDDINAINAARRTLQAISKRCVQNFHNAPTSGTGCAQDYGRIDGLADSAEHALFQVLNWTRAARVGEITDEQMHLLKERHETKVG